MDATATWTDLQVELDRWAMEGRVADFWWRDDDAVEVTPALERLLELHSEADAPLALAIIPARAQASLAVRLTGAPGVAALQHGWAHQNHASVTAKKSELPADRPLAQRLDDLRTGHGRMKDMFGGCLQPVLVPPWNRAAEDLLPALPGLGFTAISGFKPRTDYWAGGGLVWLNTHVDPIDWHGGNAAIGAARALHAACAMLRGMRLGELPLQPLGLLTHHLRHDESIWDFTARFLDTTRHMAVQWVDTTAALRVGRPAGVIPPVMTRLYYPATRLLPDYLRAGLGLAMCLGLLLFAAPQSVIFALLAGLSLLLTWLGAVTLWRQQTEIALDASGVTRTGRWGLGKRLVLPWGEVRKVTLRYYSTRRDRSEGWLRVTIEGIGGTLRADSELIGFPQLVGQALAAAERNGAVIDEASRLNAAHLQVMKGL